LWTLTWKVITDNTQKIIYCSLFWPYSIDDPNFCAVMSGGEESGVIDDPLTPIIKSYEPSSDSANHDTTSVNLYEETEMEMETQPNEQTGIAPTFNLDEHIGCMFLLDPTTNGEVHQAKIVQMLEDHESSINNNPTLIKFCLSINNDKAEEVITYNKLFEYIA
jgi:hypothetical protein